MTPQRKEELLWKKVTGLEAEVSALKAENERLRKALTPFARHAPVYDTTPGEMSGARFTCGALTEAKAALERKPE